MKSGIHPEYKTITFTCNCGAEYAAGSTIKDEFKTEICSNCHPFYTGKQKLVDSSGRVERFMKRREEAQKKAEQEVATVDQEEAEEVAKETTAEKTEDKEE